MNRSILLFIAPVVLVGCTTPANKEFTSVLAISSEAEVAQSRDAEATQVAQYRADARSIEVLINRSYAYLDRFGSATAPISDKLRIEAEKVSDRRSLLRYAERVLLSLSDHHAITGSSFANSWAIVPSYADLWVLKNEGVYTIDAVRSDSPAQEAGIRRGDRIVSVDGIPIQDAVSAF